MFERYFPPNSRAINSSGSILPTTPGGIWDQPETGNGLKLPASHSRRHSAAKIHTAYTSQKHANLGLGPPKNSALPRQQVLWKLPRHRGRKRSR